MKNLFHLLVFIIFFSTSLKAQTPLVKTAWIDTLGVPAYYFSNIIAKLDATQTMLIANGDLTGVFSESTVQLINNSDGSLAWADNFTITGFPSNYGTACYLNSNFAYVTGVAVNSTNNTNFYLYKLNRSDGSTAFDTVFSTSTFSGYQVPTSILVDSVGSIYIGGTSQVDSFEYAMFVIKFDSNGHKLWTNLFDTANLYTGAAGMIISSGNLVVTGFSGSDFTSWDFATVSFNTGTGSLTSVNRSSNGSGSFSSPAGIMKEVGRIIISGTAATSTGHTVIKTISYDDSLLTQQWTTTWGDSMTVNSGAASLVEDANGNPAIAGYTTASGGAKQAVLLSYNGGTSSLNFAKTISAPNPAYDAQGVSLSSDGNNIYMASSISNGTTHSIVTTAINYSGTTQWQQTYNRSLSTDDVPLAVIATGADVIVTGKSSGTDTLYIAVDYSQDKTSTAPDSTAPQQQWAYYDNLGQLIDTGIHQASYIHYYTNTSNPRLYVTDAALSYVFERRDSTTDTLQRVDLLLKQSKTGNAPNTSPTYYSTEQITPYLNYYVGGLPQFYEDVHGYERITAKDIYPNIDWQLYSDSGGLKYYYVVNPGGTPNDITFGYAGADSITVDSVSGLHIYSRYGVANQLPFTAWQYSGGTATQISLTLSALDSADFYFTTGSYDNTQPLYIRMTQYPQSAQQAQSIGNLEWSTKIGGNGNTFMVGITGDNNGNEFVLGTGSCSNLSVIAGVTPVSSYASGSSRDVFIAEFNNLDNMVWCTYYGIANSSIANSQYINAAWTQGHQIAVESTDLDATDEPLYFLAAPGFALPSSVSISGILPLGTFSSTYQITTLPSSSSDGDNILARLNGRTGGLTYGTLLPSYLNFANSLAISGTGNLFVAGGTNSSPTIINPNTSFQDASGTGVLMQFDDMMNIVWSTGFGCSTPTTHQNQDNQIADIAFDASGNLLITGAASTSFSYSYVPPSGAYSQGYTCTHINSYLTGNYENAYVAKFTPTVVSSSTQYTLYWYSLFGGTYANNGTAIASDQNNNIYIGGSIFSSAAGLPTSPAPIGSMTSIQNNIIAEFNATGALQWVNIFGSNGQDFLNSMACDANNNLFVSGWSFGFASFTTDTKSGWYNDAAPTSGAPFQNTFVGEFNSSNTEQWMTLFGSGGGDYWPFLSVNGDNLYLIEQQTQDISGYTFPYVQSSYANAYFFQDANIFGTISRFDVNSTFTGITDVNKSADNINVYPNPANDYLYISIPNNDNRMKQVEIVNMLGQVMETMCSVDNLLKINCSDLSIGLYIVSVKTATTIYSAKFVIN